VPQVLAYLSNQGYYIAQKLRTNSKLARWNRMSSTSVSLQLRWMLNTKNSVPVHDTKNIKLQNQIEPTAKEDWNKRKEKTRWTDECWIQKIQCPGYRKYKTAKPNRTNCERRLRKKIKIKRPVKETNHPTPISCLPVMQQYITSNRRPGL
jgi:hypothetical protein